MLFYSVTFQCSECTDSILCPDYGISDFAARTHSAIRGFCICNMRGFHLAGHQIGLYNDLAIDAVLVT